MKEYTRIKKHRYLSKLINSKLLLVLLWVFVISFVGYILLFYNKYPITIKGDTRLTTESRILELIQQRYSLKSYFLINSTELKEYVMSNCEYVEAMDIQKSLFLGLVLIIKEVDLKFYIRHNGSFIFIKKNALSSAKSIIDGVPVFDFLGENISIDIDTLNSYLVKIFEVYLSLGKIGEAFYFFDNFGNLLVRLDRNEIKFDLNERFNTINSQLDIVQKVLGDFVNEENRIVDARDRYLIVKSGE